MPGARAVRDLEAGEAGIVYGIAEDGEFFAFDINTGWVLHFERLRKYGPLPGSYLAHKVMELMSDGKLYPVSSK